MRCGCRPSRHRARVAGVPTVATSDVLYHAPGRRILQDVLTCIREGCTIDDLGFRRERSADRHLQAARTKWPGCSPATPSAVARTQEIADRCRFSLDELRYQYPHEVAHPRPDRAADAGAADLGGRGAALSRAACRTM